MIKRRKAPSGTVGSSKFAEDFSVSPNHVHNLMNKGIIPEVTSEEHQRVIPTKWVEGIVDALGGAAVPNTGHKFKDFVTSLRWFWGFHGERPEGSADPLTCGAVNDFFWVSHGPNSQNETTEEPAQFELPTEEGPRKISKEEIPAFRCSYEESFDCTAEGSEYDVNLDIALREKGPWAGMKTVKCKNMCPTEVNGEIIDWWCNREGLAEPIEKLHNLKDPRREEIQREEILRLRREASASAAKADDLESELANG
jgi:hypothetical protein